jgi:hypothetical protein
MSRSWRSLPVVFVGCCGSAGDFDGAAGVFGYVAEFGHSVACVLGYSL